MPMRKGCHAPPQPLPRSLRPARRGFTGAPAGCRGVAAGAACRPGNSGAAGAAYSNTGGWRLAASSMAARSASVITGPASAAARAAAAAARPLSASVAGAAPAGSAPGTTGRRGGRGERGRAGIGRGAGGREVALRQHARGRVGHGWGIDADRRRGGRVDQLRPGRGGHLSGLRGGRRCGRAPSSRSRAPRRGAPPRPFVHCNKTGTCAIRRAEVHRRETCAIPD